jgi:hypothetical protein
MQKTDIRSMSHCTGIKSEWVKRPKNLEIAGDTRELIGIGNEFLNSIQMA